MNYVVTLVVDNWSTIVLLRTHIGCKMYTTQHGHKLENFY
jgi:hypothetical protein